MPADPQDFEPEDFPPPPDMLSFNPAAPAPVAQVPFSHLSREQKSAYIKDHPEDFMVCCGCRGIDFRAEIRVCPMCHAYRHSYEDIYVMMIAEEIGTRETQSLPFE